MHKIAVFASGAGSNAQKIIDHFRQHVTIQVGLIVSNKPDAGVVEIAKAAHIPVLFIEKEKFFRGDAYVHELKESGISFIVLAGFLWKVPAPLIQSFPLRIINVHPALLPKYGGRGMYGSFVHKAVKAAGDTETGITIHYVDEKYDNGDIILQVSCPVDPSDTPETIAAKVHTLEYAHFPQVIEQVISGSLY
ncbi:MAG: phosphoribosylglycinamide formyltransferase [Chitinophagaceae bacterium]|nr:phosphoribosylglycinamide formyltransferase [Chitinophagaceae bacterium]